MGAIPIMSTAMNYDELNGKTWGDILTQPIWECEVCGKKRLYHEVGVITYKLKNLPGGERNLKYCLDDIECMTKAIAKSQTGEI